MPNSYPPGSFVPELRGRVDGAISVVCHAPFDLECLYAVVALAPRPPGSPLGSLAHALSQPIDWTAWWSHWRAEGGRVPDLDALDSSRETKATSSESTEDESEPPESVIENLKLALAALFHIWRMQADDVVSLACCVSVAVGSDQEGSALEWVGTEPALAFGGGSIWVRAGIAGWKARGFLAGLVLGGGIDAASRSAGLVARARATALRRQPGILHLNALEDLRERPKAAAPGQEKLCVLVHGLCSTDVGTFDAFEAALRARSGTGANPKLAIVGFPHDSLTTSAEANGHQLAQLLVDHKARECRLVCHSRGGLVARWAAIWLKKELPAQPKWIHSCVTFGTPHLGTSAASAPGGLTGAMLSLAHLSRSPGAQSVGDVLAGTKGGTFVGVSELQPAGGESSGLTKLQDAEAALFLDDALPLRTIGSRGPGWARRRSWKVRLMARVLGTADHDLLVPIASSVPKLRDSANAEHIDDRTHFEYFSHLPTEAGNDPPYWERALVTLGLRDK